MSFRRQRLLSHLAKLFFSLSLSLSLSLSGPFLLPFVFLAILGLFPQDSIISCERLCDSYPSFVQHLPCASLFCTQRASATHITMEEQPDQPVQADIDARQPDQQVQADVDAGFPKPRIKDILSRLPVKSLIRFSSACRAWKDIISDLQFVNEHLERSLKNYKRQKLYFSWGNTAFIEMIERNEDIESDHDDVVTKAIPRGLTFMVVKPGNREAILGSCNGLLCLMDDHKIHFFNPSTGVYKSIRGPLGAFDRASSSVRMLNLYKIKAYGFGYDSSTNDYKIVLVSPSLLVDVYSLRTHAWRLLFRFNYGFAAEERGIFFEGALHWVVCREPSEAEHCRSIIGFDLSTEKFWDMPAPKMPHSGSHFVLGIMRERLCLSYSCSAQTAYDFWLMNRYRNSTSWRRYSIQCQYQRMEPLCSGKDSETYIVEKDDTLIQYEVGTFKWRKVWVNGYPQYTSYKVIAYLETLVSPYMYD